MRLEEYEPLLIQSFLSFKMKSLYLNVIEAPKSLSYTNVGILEKWM